MFNRVAERYCQDIERIDEDTCNAKSCLDLECDKETEECIPDSGNALGHICAGTVTSTEKLDTMNKISNCT